MELLYTLLIYELIIIVSFSLLPRLKKDGYYKVFVFFAVVIFLVICASRKTYFPDTQTYMTMYERVEWGDLKTINLLAKEPKSYTEYGFVLFMLLFKTCHIPFEIMSLAITIFSIFSFYYFSDAMAKRISYQNGSYRTENYQKYFPAFFAVYLPIYGVFYNFVAIRSSISLSFVGLAVAMLCEKKYIKSAIFVFCGFCVQRMTLLALAAILIMLLWKREIKKNTFLVMWSIAGAVLLIDYWFNVFFKVGMQLQVVWNSIMHTDIQFGMQEVDSHALKRFLLFVAYWFNGLAFVVGYEKIRKNSNILITYICSIMIGCFVSGFSASYRIVDYFYMFAIPLNYYIIKNKDDYDKIQTLLVTGTTCMFLLSWGLYFYQYMAGIG